MVEGVDIVKVHRCAGHKPIGTTMRCIVEAENRGATFSVPFPPLPLSLLRLGQRLLTEVETFYPPKPLTIRRANGGS